MSDHEFRDIAELLTQAPSSRFRDNLRRRLALTSGAHLEGETAMSYMRPGFHTVTPYLIVSDAAALLAFTQRAFGAEEGLRIPADDGKIRHGELRIGDSIIEFADEIEGYPARPLPLHVYVEDVDAVYAQAVATGATSLREPADQPYGDRDCALRDAFGNHWYIGTHRATGHRPVGLRSVTPYLHAQNASDLVAFLEAAFSAETLERHADPTGRLAHCKLSIGDSILELSDAQGEWQPMPGYIQLYMPDIDEAYRRALAAGATSGAAPEDKPYGERMAEVRDPQGNTWFLAHFLGQR